MMRRESGSSSRVRYGLPRLAVLTQHACAALVLLMVAISPAVARAGVTDTIFADGFDVDFAPVVPAEISIRQGGIITVAVVVSGNGFQDGRFGLSGPVTPALSSTARLHSAATGKLGYSFESVHSQGGNLSLYVGRDVPVGNYSLTLTANASGATHATSFVLHVLAKGTVYEIWPPSYEDALPALQPGDVLVLHEGTYTDYQTLYLDGSRESPITIRGYGNGEARPVLLYPGDSHNHWEIRGSHLIVQGLEFDTPEVYSIRIRPPSSGAVENVSLVHNVFVGCGGGCVSANDSGASYRDIRLIDNLMLDTLRTPVYIGNHQGTATFDNFLFEGNVIDGRLITANDVVGYGIEVKLNVENAVLRHNYIVGTRGPGIMTYGMEASLEPSHRGMIEGNIVIDSCNDQNILLGAGPVIARDNLTMGGHFTGIGISDYGNRHLSSGIEVYRNTSLLNQPWGFWIKPTIPGTGLENLVMTNNLAYPGTAGAGYGNLPADTVDNVIANNAETAATTAMSSLLDQLRYRIPSPQDLKSIWPLLTEGPLQAAELETVLGMLAALPNQSSNTSPRTCP